MWKQNSACELRAEIDTVNSWHDDSLVPADIFRMPIKSIQPKSLPLKVSKLTAKATGFLFPEANQWTPPVSPSLPSNRKKRKRVANLQRHRIKPPNEVVKLQDRLYYLLQPPLDSLVGSGQLNFPFDPFPYQLDGTLFFFHAMQRSR